mmetsp:Transcript_11919/g.22760  ORF Transcript_11919/g.22760 Transcript_11919/m.22760 type:complete len:623 (+) Transcript_11919:237-2105(+)|eukprot:CAMPEP_0114317410 /NCGR_PEP_ID=MMETSP0059-20121206/23860_1 /TAXON_ID=36894 /ORGANISM="Pyramimonas parkeae, Strain CCMP726" /LENGTH=622 /DNA_ID=CAMNT_0001443683 /DNA_START=1171 /DNA_END=3039 /DNA_ORIENTATION=-
MFLTWDNKPSGQWCPDGFGWGTHVAKEGCSTPERTTRLVSNVADAFVEKTDVLNTTINTKISPFETQRRGVRHALRYFTLMHSVPSSPSLDAKLHDLRGHKEGCTFNESSNRDKVAGRTPLRTRYPDGGRCPAIDNGGTECDTHAAEPRPSTSKMHDADPHTIMAAVNAAKKLRFLRRRVSMTDQMLVSNQSRRVEEGEPPTTTFKPSSLTVNRSHSSSFTSLLDEVMYANALKKQHEYVDTLRRQTPCKCGRLGGWSMWSRKETIYCPYCSHVRPATYINDVKLEKCRRELRKTVWLKIKSLVGNKAFYRNTGDHIMVLHTHQWIEATDPKHRYGGNLVPYFMAWLKSTTDRSFFEWLDYGDGAQLDLDTMPRHELEQACVKYCGFMERKRLEVVVQDGLLVYKESGQVVDYPAESVDKLIFVMSPGHLLYIALKSRGRFHHSSFLAGGPALAAGAMKVVRGQLQTIVPHSGHYRPSEHDFWRFVQLLEDMGIPMDNVECVPFKNYSRKDKLRNEVINKMINNVIERQQSESSSSRECMLEESEQKGTCTNRAQNAHDLEESDTASVEPQHMERGDSIVSTASSDSYNPVHDMEDEDAGVSAAAVDGISPSLELGSRSLVQ